MSFFTGPLHVERERNLRLGYSNEELELIKESEEAKQTVYPDRDAKVHPGNNSPLPNYAKTTDYEFSQNTINYERRTLPEHLQK